MSKADFEEICGKKY
ncbi:MAG: hypothetical protein ACLUGP_14130 [Faecalibacterium prausnitzii]